MKRKNYKDLQEYLDDVLCDPKFALDYLNEVLKSQDKDAFLLAVKDVLRAHPNGFSAITRKAHLSRPSVYRMLSKNGNPRWDSLNALFDTMGYQVQLTQKTGR